MTPLPTIEPQATMEEAWRERDRLSAEGDCLSAEQRRLSAEGDLVVILTAQALYGKKVQIDWQAKTAKP